jgi:putative ABC transport system permease protein
MNWLRQLVEWLRGGRHEAALAEELEAHRAFAQDEMERSGLPPAIAAAESRRRMGNVTLVREEVRDVWTVRWANRLRQNVRYGARGLRREPLFALTVILTLALGSAATITVFGVVDAELWRALPYPDPHRLLAVRSRGPWAKSDTDGISLEEFLEWRRTATAFKDLAAEGSWGRHTVQLDRAESILISEVTANYFATLGRTPLAGRIFTDLDSQGGGVAVLTERGWQRIFARDPAVVGRTFRLDGRSIEIVGLVARDDSIGPDPEMYLPLDEGTTTAPLFSMIGRLMPEMSTAVAREQLQSALSRRGAIDQTRRGHVVEVDDLSHFYRRTDERPLIFFLAAAAAVLILTVANTAGLLVSRAIRRTPEFALRSALGGDRGTLAAQTMIEGALVALPGCALGLLAASLAVHLTTQYVPADLLWRGTHIRLDLRAAAFTVAVAAATSAVLTLVPLGILRKAGAREALGSGSRTGDAPRTARVGRILLVGQLALTVILLAGAGLFLRSFVALTTVPIGFDPSNAWSLSVTLSGPSYSTPAAIREYIDSAIERLQAVPGVRYAAPATSSPLKSGWLAEVTPHEAVRTNDPAASVGSVTRLVGPEYFQATGTRIVRGRGISSQDNPGGPLAAVVNEEFARRMFPGQDAIGKTVDFAGIHAAPVGQGTATIVGVAANIKEIGMNEVRMPDFYLAFAQHPSSVVELLVRSDRADAALPTTLRAAITDPFVPVTAVSEFSTRVDRALEPDRFNLMVVGGFAAIAVLMSAVGVYGAMAYAASARQREFGVRLALGATPRTLLCEMLWRSARLSLVAATVGLGGALLIAKALGTALYLVPGEHNGLLYHVTTTDPLALASALGGIMVLSVVASAIPARRAGQTSPVTALRGD